MSDEENQPNDQAEVEAAKVEYEAFLKTFEAKHGYGIGALSEANIGPDSVLRVNTFMKLVKLPAQIVEPKTVEEEENPANTPPNGDSTTKETGTGDSEERQQS